MQDVAAIVADVWRRLSRAVVERDHPFRFGAIATAEADGAPAARTVVLRRVDAADRTLWFHTDRRSPKVAQLAADPRVTWLLWDPTDKLQIRLIGRATVHLDDPPADTLWADVPPAVRVTYQSPHPPGTAIDRPHRNVPDAGGDAGREHFAAVEVRVERVDWLQLDAGGHRRARISLVGGLSGGWVTP